ncbi:MAG: hypothetical protein IPM66_04030 [Acidobacteriota bacterium]|nr:MAG: hypothetical protein IPM66_04030 [Acidobacteriota bacterium]
MSFRSYFSILIMIIAAAGGVFTLPGGAARPQESRKKASVRERERSREPIRMRRDARRREASPGKAGRGVSPREVELPGETRPAGRTETGVEEVGSLLDRMRARYDQPREAMEFFRMKRLSAGMKDLPVEKYLEAGELMKRMPRYSSLLDRKVTAGEVSGLAAQPGTWQPLGPGNIGGRTRAMLIHPQNPDVMYAAGVSGGVWKTLDGGASWNPISDLIGNITVSSMVFEPGNPETIYIGTGEGVAVFSRDTQGDFRGAGIFRTTDGGMTWSRLASTTGEDFYFVNDLVISPHDKNRIYAATRSGVWLSVDAGASWTRALDPQNDFNETVLGGCLDLAIRTDQPGDFILASCGTFENASVYRSTDASGGGGWTRVLGEDGMGRTALAISPANQNVVYALASSIEFGPYELALYAVFRSNDGGATWTPVLRNTSSNKFNTSILSIPQLAVGSDCGFAEFDDFFGQGWFDLVIAVDPIDSNRVWAGGIDIFRSDDGGVNWGLAGPAYASTNFELGPIHPDQHVIVFHPGYDGASNQIMYVGNDGGLYRTDNARGSVAQGTASICGPIDVGVKWRNINNNYGVTQFYHGTSTPDGKSYFGGTQDNGTVLGTDTAGIDGWKEINGGDGGYVAVDPTDPLTFYASFTGISFRKSTDGGKSFGVATSGIGSGDTGFFITPYAMDPSEPQTLWTGGDYVWRTTSGAARWERASALTAGTTKVSAIAVAPTDSNKVLVGMGDGYILRNQAALEATSATFWVFSRPRDGYVSSIAFDPNNRDIVYATYSTFGGRHVWRSIDGGILWTSIDGQGESAIPDVPVHSIVIDPSNTTRLYVGTDVGVFVSNDGGAGWAVENTGFANVITESLQLRVIDGVTMLYAFTHGRGAWRAPINNAGCNFALSPSTRQVGSGSSSGTISVTAAPAGCNWSVSSNVSWLSVSGGGSSDGQADFAVEENTGFESRTGTATIAGRSFTIVQRGRDDGEVPVIAITSPAGNPVTGNTSGVISLAGTARDNRGVTAVRWRNNRGLSGSAGYNPDTQTWAVDNIPLAAGLNTITVSAEDVTGNIGRSSIDVGSIPQSILVTMAGSGKSGNTGDGGKATKADLSRPIRIDIDAAGNLYLTDSDNNTVRKVTSEGIITTIAGTGAEGYTGDGGPAIQARLNFPIGVAVDQSGNVYICDNFNSAIRKVTAATGFISTLAGNGSDGYAGDGGPAAGAILNNPQNVAVDAAGNVYISDFGNHRIRRISAADGMITTVAGNGTLGYSGDGGPATSARLNLPNNVWVDGAGNIFISDAGNSRIRKVNAADGMITTVAGNGARGFSGDGGPATNAELFGPACAITDEAGNLYISDRSNNRVRRVAVDTGIITTIAGDGQAGFSGDGLAGTASALNSPTGLAFDPQGRLHIADRQNRRVRRLASGDISDQTPPVIAVTEPVPTPVFMTVESAFTLSGTASDNVALSQILWSNDRGGGGTTLGLEDWTVERIPLQQGDNRITVTAWDINGNSSSAVLTVTFSPAQIMTTFAGLGPEGNTGDPGAALAARLSFPSGIAFDAQGNLYLAEAGNHRVRKITPGGLITAFAGNGMLGNSGDGGPAVNARLNEPTSVAVDPAGNVYIADVGNNRIRRVSPDGVITTYAGTGIDGYSGDGGPAAEARLNLPIGVAVDRSGNLLIADAGNLRVRKVNAATGVMTTIAGDGRVGFGGDGGQATQAQFRFPFGVTVDPNGVVYVIDAADHRVRRISPDGMISTFVGTGDPGFSGDGGPAVDARINFPSYIRTDSAGNLYIADYSNHRIRKVAPATGIITTVAGSGSGAYGGDGSAPLLADLNLPNDIDFDAQGNLYIADYRNHRIRKVLSPGAFLSVTGVSAASFRGESLASESIVAAFGTNLATVIRSADQVPLPVDLEGTTVRVKDNEGIERLSPLFFVAPGQINFQIPPSTANGLATISVAAGNGALSQGTALIANTSPGIFAANADGRGVAAGLILRVKADGTQLFEPVASFDQAANRFVGLPVDLGPDTDQVFLILFGTGARFGNSPASATIGDQPAEVLFVGAQGGFIGLDQINLRLDRSLIGRGEVEIQLSIDGRLSNPVTIRIQ